ncbi:hypothetical protein BJ973_005086 [Actinoplanes tereljensis]|uniref:Uncharacterized protein n=1 Tax=Paractinoplanes tereljensis TaxID=571912 RepID=A0A919NPF4_9ACTN|nr:hypothetical protein [Actinoplanes tereljensis]GIF21467.1 hypothetical protein Ate02nite_41970 [Actinoplanes tereljensis]
MTYPCPNCRATASSETGCPSCGRAPDADAILVIETDNEIAGLLPQLATARRAVSDLETRISHAYARRNQAAERVRASQSPAAPAPSPETSSRAVQNVLFLLGGLLLAVAAIVFTAVAWSQFGVGGRAAVLGVVTVAALAVPLLALRRGLRGAAETVAALGILLLLLDGYAAWYVNLFGLAGGSPARYAGVVFALTAAIAAGYGYLTGLTGPRYAALLAAQPALPLLIAPAHPGPAGWTLTFGLLAALDVAVRRTRVAPLAYALGGLATLAAITPALVAAGRTVDAAGPVFHATWSATVYSEGWRLPAALALVAVALTVALPPRARPAATIGGAAAIALALPSGLHLPWWNGPLIDLVVLTAALALAARHAAPALAVPATRVAALPAAASPTAASSVASFLGGQGGLGAAIGLGGAGGVAGFAGQLVAAALLGGHALVAGFGRPGLAAAVLTVLALLGFGLATAARHPGLRGAGLVTGFLAVPAIAWTASAALGLSGAGQLRCVAVATAALVCALRLLPARREALVAVLVVTTLLPVWALVAGEPVVVYLVLALLLAAATSTLTRDRRTEIAVFVPAGFVLVVGLLGDLLSARTGTLAGLGALLVAAAVTGTAGRTAQIRGLGVAVTVVAGWGVALAAAPGTVLEAYTLPAAGLALAAGLLARRDPAPSWVSYGPALTTALTPSLVSIFVDEGQYLRPLLLGAGALAILLVGARARLRAPVVAGSLALALVALHELTRVWDLVPRWIPPAAGGVLLVVLAATLERRRRDLARFRGALGRMS